MFSHLGEGEREEKRMSKGNSGSPAGHATEIDHSIFLSQTELN